MGDIEPMKPGSKSTVPQLLGSMISPPISSRQAKKSVELLEKIGFVKMMKSGRYGVRQKDLATGSEILSVAVAKFHKECIQLASDALDNIPSDHRNFSGLTLGISKKTYQKILSELTSFQQTVLQIASEDKSADRVYHFNFHLFPASKYENLPQKKK